VDLVEKSRRLPALPGVYQFKNAEGTVIYVGKAKDLRARVRTYFLAGQWENAKTGSLLREAVDIETIVVDTEAEALALENTLIKQYQPRFNVLLRDDKTYPYIRLSQETYPRVYVTRRLLPDGSEYFGPYFPAGFAYRLVHFIHKHFLVPSCRVDLTRFHPRPCLQFHIRRCLGPCVEGLTTVERYQQAVRDTRLFLSGRQAELARELRRRRDAAAGEERFEEAAGYRDLLTVLEQAQDRQKMHAVEGEDADIVGFHREGARAALNLFHLRHGRVVDRREHFWEDLPDPPLAATAGRLTSGTRGAGALGPAPTKAQRSAGLGPGGPQVGVSTSGTRGAGALGPAPTEAQRSAGLGPGGPQVGVSTSGTRGAGALGPAPTEAQRSAGLGPGGPQVGVSTSGTRGAGALGPAPTEDWLGALLKQIYLGQPYLPPRISVPEEFEDRELLQAALARQRGGAVEIATPQRGAKKALLELAAKNAQLSFARRFRSAPADVQARDDWQALAAALGVELGAEPGRIECFDISHFQGAETVASMVVWEAGALRRGDYRKFRIRGVAGVDDFRSIQEVVRRRYQRRLADRGGRAALPAGKTGAKGCEIPQGGSPPGSEFGAAPAKRSAGLGPRGPQAGASTSGTRAAGALGPAPTKAAALPSLVLIDGGIGQLHAARKALEELGLGALPLASLAKREELVHVFGREHQPLRLDPHAPALRLLQSIRDEAHRFAITFHRQRREKGTLRSELLHAPGIGPAAVRKLLGHFGSLAAVQAAAEAQLAAVLPASRARALWHHLHPLAAAAPAPAAPTPAE